MAVLVVASLACGRAPTGDAFPGRAAVALAFAVDHRDPGARRPLSTGTLTAAVVQLTRTNGLPALDTVVTFPAGADSVAVGLHVWLAPSAPAAGEPMTLRVALADIGGVDICTGGPLPVVVSPAWNATAVTVPLACVVSPVPIDSLPPIDSLLPPIDSLLPPIDSVLPPIDSVLPPIDSTPVVHTVSRLTFGTVIPTVVAGTPLAPEVVVTAVDAAGGVVSTFAEPVSVSAIGPAGAVLGGTRTVTATGGVARFTDLLLTMAGTYRLSVASAGFTSTSNTFDILPADPRQLAAAGGTGQTGIVGALLGSAVAAVVTDAFGNAVPGVDVTWQVISGLGQLLSPVTRTGPDGIARNQWTLGLLPGTQAITATVGGLVGSPVTFDAQALLPAAAARDLP